MKKLLLLLTSAAIMLGISVNTLAADSHSNTEVISVYDYSGSISDFEIIISRNINPILADRHISENNVEFTENEFGIKASINVDNELMNNELTWQFLNNTSATIEVEEDGSLLIYDDNNELVGATSSLKLKDSNNSTVDVSAKSLGNVVQYKIGGDDNIYPLSGEIQLYGVNDFSQWFSSGGWITRDGKISLSLTHTGWAYAGIETGPITWSWNTVKNKFSGSANWRNAQGMLEQYQCHVNFAANKNPWNLEPWRPSVGYANTITAACNP